MELLQDSGECLFVLNIGSTSLAYLQCGMQILAETQEGTFLYGFELSSNNIYGECEILLPWYSNHSLRQIVIDCRDAKPFDVYVNGYLQQVKTPSRENQFYLNT